MLPTWRPDKGMMIEDTPAFTTWLDKLGAVADYEIRDFASYLQALERRHAFFHARGCRLSDHGLETIDAEDYTASEIESIFSRARTGQSPTPAEARKFKSAMLYEFGRMDAARGWVQQFHLGALRHNNRRQYAALGPDVGYDSIGDFELARPLARLLGRLDHEGCLAKTILYNINPRDNELIATMLGNYQEGPTPGKLQMGSAWWFLDQIDGMTRQIEALSQLGLLRRFVGMLTDSRSLLSYTRHEYFRRILCSVLGRDMQLGLIPPDMELVAALVRDVCFNNASRYFGFNMTATEETGF
jgi:glucuronate isomerase